MQALTPVQNFTVLNSNGGAVNSPSHPLYIQAVRCFVQGATDNTFTCERDDAHEVAICTRQYGPASVNNYLVDDIVLLSSQSTPPYTRTYTGKIMETHDGLATIMAGQAGTIYHLGTMSITQTWSFAGYKTQISYNLNSTGVDSYRPQVASCVVNPRPLISTLSAQF